MNSHILHIRENVNYEGQFLKFLFRIQFDVVSHILFGLFLTVIDKLSESKFSRDSAGDS